MTTLRDWVAKTLRENDQAYESEATGDRGLVVARDDLPDAKVYCADASDTEPFRASDLKAALQEMPNLQFVTVVRRQIANDTYTLADEEGVAVGGFPALTYALMSSINVGRYRSSTHAYVASRLDGNATVSSWRRVAYNGYEIRRRGGRRTVTTVTLPSYEVTADGIYEILTDHPGIEIDAIVTTNPNCRGFSRASFRAVEDADIKLMTFPDLLTELRTSWTD